MSTLSAQTVSPNLLTPSPTGPTTYKGESKAQIASTAQSFESTFLSNMLGEMFAGVSSDGPFDGGAGEGAFRSFLMDSFAQQMTKNGGVGIASAVQKEMLKMQGMTS